jgi:hypothetical protein
MLGILKACVPLWVPGKTLASLGPANSEYWHLMIEAKKLACGCRGQHGVLGEQQLRRVRLRSNGTGFWFHPA